MSTGPQLSSVATVLSEMTARVAAIADQLAGTEQEDVAAALYEVERSLLAAGRRLETVVDDLT